MRQWLYVIDLSFMLNAEPQDGREVKEFANRVADVIEASDAYQEHGDDINMSVEAIRSCTTADDFDCEFALIYDWGDEHSIWIETRDPDVFKRHVARTLTRR